MFVALDIQHAKRMRRIMSSVSCTAITYFPKLLHKRRYFRKKNLLVIKCVFIFSTTPVWNISHSKKNSARYKRARLHVPHRLCLSDIKETWIFSTNFRKILLIKFRDNSWSGSRVVSRWRTDRQTYRHDETNSRFYAIFRTSLKWVNNLQSVRK